MARITNIHGLPEELVRAVTPRPKKHPNDIYLTQATGWTDLMFYLHHAYGDQIVEDAADKLYMLLGSSVHYIIEKGAGNDALAEERISIPVLGFNLVMRPDLWKAKTITDWKVTSVWSYLLGEKDEWGDQLNGYAWGLWEYGFETDTLLVQAIFRNWERRKAMYDKDYPPIPFASVKYPLVPYEETKKTITEKLMAFRRVLEGYVPEVCPDKYRWYKPDTFAVRKKRTKRALPGGAKFRSREEAEAWLITKEAKQPQLKLEIDHRKGEYSRCMGYCSARMVCPYNPYINDEGAEDDGNS